MTPESYRLVRESWARLAADPDVLASRFYDGLFELAPHLRRVFAGVDLAEQRRKFVDMLDAIVGVIDAPEQFIPTLAALGRRHVEYGAVDADYDAVAAALLAALEQSLGAAFTPTLRDAWIETYRLIAGIMRRAAARTPTMLTSEMSAAKREIR